MLSNRIKLIPPSPTLAINAKAKAMKAAGVDVISMATGEPDFDVPEYVKEAAIKAIKEGFNKYTPVGGIPELKEAIIDFIAQEYGLKYNPEEVLVCCGGKQALYNLFQVILNPGDEVIIPAPYWVSYPPMVLLAGGKPVLVDTKEEHEFKLTPEELLSHLSPWTKAIILNSPSNPTGSVYTAQELKELAKVLRDRNIWIISDDVYHKILLKDDVTWTSIAAVDEDLRPKTFIVNALSKTFGVTGWRIGYLIGNKEVVKAATRLQSQSTSNPNSIAQRAAVVALKGSKDFLNDWIVAFRRRITTALKILGQIPEVSCFEPQGAFYLFPNVSYYCQGRFQNSVGLSEYLLEEAKVAVVPGSAFGKEGYIRLSCATSDELVEKACYRIKQALERV